jgi:hypothetical protein
VKDNPGHDHDTTMTDNHVRRTYNEIHKLIGNAAEKIQTEFNPDLLIAIGMNLPLL